MCRGSSALREADRLALLGLVGAAMLAGAAVDWLGRHARPLIAVVAVLGALRGGLDRDPGARADARPPTARRWTGPSPPTTRTRSCWTSRSACAAGIPLYGSPIARRADTGHRRRPPAGGLLHLLGARARPPLTSSATRSTPGWWPSRTGTPSRRRWPRARRDVRGMNIGWVLVWGGTPRAVIRYLTGAGFVFSYRADQVSCTGRAGSSGGAATAAAVPSGAPTAFLLP